MAWLGLVVALFFYVHKQMRSVRQELVGKSESLRKDIRRVDVNVRRVEVNVARIAGHVGADAIKDAMTGLNGAARRRPSAA